MSTGALACFHEGAWRLLPSPERLRRWIADEAIPVIMGHGGWTSAAPARQPRLGINTDSDETNHLAVKSDAVLLSHDDLTPGSGDMHLVINRLAAGNAASLLFQTDYTAEAELALAGASGVDLRTSPDGTSFNTRLGLRASDVRASFPSGFEYPLAIIGQLQMRHSLGTIADDTVATVNFGEPVYGTALLAIPNSLTSGPLAFYFARMTTTPGLTPLFSGGHTFTSNTGELTGTTGPYGGINFSATSDGRFQTEHRRGFPVNHTVYTFR